MSNAVVLRTMHDLRGQIKDMVVGEKKIFTCPPDFTNEKAKAILGQLVWDRGVAYGIEPGEEDNQFIIYTSSASINLFKR